MSNPFSKDRYEYISTHLYYLPETLISKLEETKSSYLIGSRGSGKTTLLKALNWRERLENKGLNQQLGGIPFDKKYIATYTKLPLIQINSMQEWLRNAEDGHHYVIFGHYFDLIAAEGIAFAATEILNRSALDFNVSPESELATVRAFLSEKSYLILDSDSKYSFISDCHFLLRERRRLLESFARSRKDILESMGMINFPSPGSISRSLATGLGKLIDEAEDQKYSAELEDRKKLEPAKWYFKCCFDEAECLNKRQKQVVNTVVRTSEWHVSYVISFVGEPADLSATSLEGISAQSADRYILHLDDLSNEEFESLCDGVANVRVSAAFKEMDSKDRLNDFSTRKVLGDLGLNKIVDGLVKRSENPWRHDLTKMAERFYDSPWGKGRKKDKYLPYVEAYLAETLELKAPSENKRRAQASREYRKKFVASYLSICRKLSVKKIPYAYSNMVFGISDGCVRDYLSQMYQIFIAANIDLEKFTNGTVRWELQSEALHNASKEKFDSIGTGEEVTYPERVRRLTVALGEVVGRLQRGGVSGVSALLSPEKGIFRFLKPIRESGLHANVFRILKDASEAGFICVKQENQQIFEFRLHRSLSPYFGFSYRKPQYAIAIYPEEVEEILRESTTEALKAQAEKILMRLSKKNDDSNQLDLMLDIEP